VSVKKYPSFSDELVEGRHDKSGIEKKEADNGKKED